MSFFKRLLGDEKSVQDGYRAFQRKDFHTAFRIWEELARRGESLAQFNLAKMYSDGLSVPADQRISMMYCEQSAEGGCREAQAWLGGAWGKAGMIAKRFELLGPIGKAFALNLFSEQCWNQQSEILKLENRTEETVANIMAYFLMKWLEKNWYSRALGYFWAPHYDENE